MPPVGMIQVVNRLNALFSGDFDKIDLHSHLKRLKEIPVTRRIELAKMRDSVDWTLAD